MVVVYRDPTLCPPRSPSRKPPLNLPLGRDHCKTKDIQATTTVIPAKAGASADGTSIQRGREKGKDAQIFGSRTRPRSCAKNPFAQRKRAEPRHPRRPPPNPVHPCKCPKRGGGSRTAPTNQTNTTNQSTTDQPVGDLCTTYSSVRSMLLPLGPFPVTLTLSHGEERGFCPTQPLPACVVSTETPE